jgi:hypothetical protein
MAAQYKGVPEGASAVIPRLVCRDVEAEIEFCCEALGAMEAGRRPGPNGRAAHVMLKFGSAMLMLEAEWPTLPSRAPNPDGSSPVLIYLCVEDVDMAVERALSSVAGFWCRSRATSGATGLGGCRTLLGTCGQSQRALRRQRKTNDESDGRKLYRKKADRNAYIAISRAA